MINVSCSSAVMLIACGSLEFNTQVNTSLLLLTQNTLVPLLTNIPMKPNGGSIIQKIVSKFHLRCLSILLYLLFLHFLTSHM